MRGTDGIWSRGMNARVNRERRRVHGTATLDDPAVVTNSDQVGHPDQTEVQSKWIDPESVGKLGIACRDMADNAFVEAELGEQSKACGQPLLSMQPLFLHAGKDRWLRQVMIYFCRGRFGLRRSDGFHRFHSYVHVFPPDRYGLFPCYLRNGFADRRLSALSFGASMGGVLNAGK